MVIGISGKKQSGKTSLAYYLKAKVLQSYGAYDPEDYFIDQNEEGDVFFISKDPNYNPIEVKNIKSPTVGVYSFGDTLKDCCMNTLGLSYEQCYGTDDQKNSPTKYKWENLPMNVRNKYSKEHHRKSEHHTDDPSQFGFTTTYNEKTPRSGYLTAREVMQIFGTNICREMFHDDIWVDATFKKIEQDGVGIAIIADVRFPSEVNAIINRPKYRIIRLDRTKDSSDNHSSETSLDGFKWKSLGDNSFVLDNRGMDIVVKNKIAYDWLFELEEV